MAPGGLLREGEGWCCSTAPTRMTSAIRLGRCWGHRSGGLEYRVVSWYATLLTFFFFVLRRVPRGEHASFFAAVRYVCTADGTTCGAHSNTPSLEFPAHVDATPAEIFLNPLPSTHPASIRVPVSKGFQGRSKNCGKRNHSRGYPVPHLLHIYTPWCILIPPWMPCVPSRSSWHGSTCQRRK